jgi:hypothetical protein
MMKMISAWITAKENRKVVVQVGLAKAVTQLPLGWQRVEIFRSEDLRPE